jgi:hypothetical protein
VLRGGARYEYTPYFSALYPDFRLAVLDGRLSLAPQRYST